ncbi:MAG: hypothetical protein RLY97_97 [Pseudomonadota bacterium]|jgi:nitroreductase
MCSEKPPLSAIDAVAGRKSVRRFLPDPVDDDTIRAILSGATRAASGTNVQPWRVHVVAGETRDRLSQAALAAADAGQSSPEYAYQPAKMREPYISRRRKVGFDLYGLYGVARDDMAGRKAAMMRNFTFFGAPVGLFFTMDRDHAIGAWLDNGLFMQNVMILARAHGLESCAQQAWCDFGGVVHEFLPLPDDEILISGMALGYADWSAAENTLVTERASVDEFATWHR